jgi:hypothetical protein
LSARCDTSIKGATLLLAKAATPEQQDWVGDQPGGRVSFFLDTTDFWEDYDHKRSCRLRFTETPRHEPYG